MKSRQTSHNSIRLTSPCNPSPLSASKPPRLSLPFARYECVICREKCTKLEGTFHFDFTETKVFICKYGDCYRNFVNYGN